MATPFHEQPNYLRGDYAQRRIADWLRCRGWYVIPSYDYSGKDDNKAPRMSGPTTSYVLPDLDIAKAGHRRWAEVKAKRAPNLWRKTNTLEHGIDKRHFDHYIHVQDITGAHVWIFIFEEDSQLILAESIDRLGVPRYGAQYGKGGMVNWPRDRFALQAPIDATIAASTGPLTANDLVWTSGSGK